MVTRLIYLVMQFCWPLPPLLKTRRTFTMKEFWRFNFILRQIPLEEMIGGGSIDFQGKYIQTEKEILSYKHLIDSNKKVFFEHSGQAG